MLVVASQLKPAGIQNRRHTKLPKLTHVVLKGPLEWELLVSFSLQSGISCLLLLIAAANSAAASEIPAQAKSALKQLSLHGGLIVQLGVDDGRFLATLGASKNCLVRGLTRDTGRIAVARQYLQSQGCYGRISVQHLSSQILPFADGLANVIIVKQNLDIPREEIFRVLTPRGAVMAWHDGKWEKTVKPWPVEIDEWTHWLHGADGNAVAQDQQVGPPRHLRWVAGPKWLRHHNMTISLNGIVSSNGRLFYLMDDGPVGVAGVPQSWTLYARDAFNGILLWKRRLSNWGWNVWSEDSRSRSSSRFDHPPDWQRRIVAQGDQLFLSLGNDIDVCMLDARTGDLIRSFPGTSRASELLLREDRLVTSVHERADTEGPNTGFRKKILAFRISDGELLWSRDNLSGVASKTGPLQRLTHLYLTSAGNRLFYVDEDSVVGLDLTTGRETWRVARPARSDEIAKYASMRMSNLCTLVADKERLLFAQSKAYPKYPWYTPTEITLVALSAKDGQKLWQKKCGSWNCYAPPDLFVINNLAWVHSLDAPYALLGLDLSNGTVRQQFDTSAAMVAEHHHRCYRNKATTDYVLTARRGVELLGISSHDVQLNHWIRGTCRYGILPCNGLLYVPPDPCICYITAKVNGFLALASDPLPSTESPLTDPLIRGSAFHRSMGWVADGDETSAAEWSTFRHDSQRSSGILGQLGNDLDLKWEHDCGGRPTAATAAGGRVYFAVPDHHRVSAIDAESGQPLWHFIADGPVDSPPTIYHDLVLFGSTDGSIYALSAVDGALRWRRRIAPRELQIVADGQLESAWPSHGSVLVQQGRAFVAAGRSSFLDGGIRVVALDPITGQIEQERWLATADSDQTPIEYGTKLRYDMPPRTPGALLDILTSDGKDFYMRHIRFDPSDLTRDFASELSDEQVTEIHEHQIPRIYSPGPQLSSSAGLLDDSWFNQTYWSFNNASHARILAIGQQAVFGVRAFKGRPYRHSRAEHVAGTDVHLLFADDRQNRRQRLWQRPIPIRPSSLAVAGDQLVLAGTDLTAKDVDYAAAFRGQGPGQLITTSAQDGQIRQTKDLQSAPVWNGLAIAAGRIILSLRNAKIVCYETNAPASNTNGD
jgi:outer membrane protein assembly factor BamB